MTTKESYEWDYVFLDANHENENYVYMTNKSVNIAVNKIEIETYYKKGYTLGYFKPYLHCRTKPSKK